MALDPGLHPAAIEYINCLNKQVSQGSSIAQAMAYLIDSEGIVKDCLPEGGVAGATLLLQFEQCYDEATEPGAVVGFDAQNMSGDLDDDDLFSAEVVNNTTDTLVLAAIELTIGNWELTTVASVNVNFGTGSVSVVIPVGATGQTFLFVLPDPITLAPGETVGGFISSSQGADFTGDAQEVSGVALAAGDPVQHVVRTYSDGTTEQLIEFVAGVPFDWFVNGGIPADWVACPPFDTEELTAIQAIVDAKDDLITNCIDDFVDIVGFDESASGLAGLGVPTADADLTWTPADTINADVILADITVPSVTTDVDVTLAISVGGVVVHEHTVETSGSGNDEVHDFGAGGFEFVAGTTYNFAWTSPFAITLLGQPNLTPVTFDTPVIAFDGVTPLFPGVGIYAFGENKFKRLTLSDDSRRWLTAIDGQAVDPAPTGLVPCVEPTVITEELTCPDPDAPLVEFGLGDLTGTLPDGTTWVITNGLAVSPSGGIEWGSGTILDIQFSAPVEMAIGTVDDFTGLQTGIQTWHTNPESTEIITDGVNGSYVPGTTDLVGSGQVTLTDSGAVNSGSNVVGLGSGVDWGTFSFEEVTSVQIEAVAFDQMQFAVSIPDPDAPEVPICDLVKACHDRIEVVEAKAFASASSGETDLLFTPQDLDSANETVVLASRANFLDQEENALISGNSLEILVPGVYSLDASLSGVASIADATIAVKIAVNGVAAVAGTQYISRATSDSVALSTLATLAVGDLVTIVVDNLDAAAPVTVTSFALSAQKIN